MVEQIAGYEGLYEIHLIGPDGPRVFSTFGSGRFLKPRKNPQTGYLEVNLCRDKKKKNHTIHRLVAEHFIANPDDKKCVDHIDGDKTNNRLQNLRWATHSENIHNQKRAKGYCFDKQAGKWRAYIWIDGKQIHLGLYDTEAEAKAAHEKASRELYEGIKFHD